MNIDKLYLSNWSFYDFYQVGKQVPDGRLFLVLQAIYLRVEVHEEYIYPIFERTSTVLLLCVCLCVFFRLQGPLYSETGWTGDFWAKNKVLNFKILVKIIWSLSLFDNLLNKRKGFGGTT